MVVLAVQCAYSNILCRCFWTKSVLSSDVQCCGRYVCLLYNVSQVV